MTKQKGMRMLVQIDDRNFINTNWMKRVSRNGNYTDIRLLDDQLLQIWDEDEIVFNQIKNAINQEKTK